jgi:hypothetical protein
MLIMCEHCASVAVLPTPENVAPPWLPSADNSDWRLMLGDSYGTYRLTKPELDDHPSNRRRLCNDNMCMFVGYN